MASCLDQAAWSSRSSLFGQIRAYDDGRPILVMELDPAERLEEWLWLRERWLDLSAHPHILDAIDRGLDAQLLVRYAAIAWQHAPVSLETRQARRLVATWGAQITSAFQMISAEVDEAELVHFLRPHVMIDLVNDARLVFLPVASTDVRCDEPTIVQMIGELVAGLCSDLELAHAAPIRQIIERCRSRAIGRLDDALAAWAVLAFPNLDDDRRAAWELAQEGVGWLDLGRTRAALALFTTAIDRNPRLALAIEGRDRALALLGERPPPPLPPGIYWNDVALPGQQLEDAHEFREAIALYARAKLDGRNDLALLLARARCHAALGDHGHAIDFAGRVLAIEPANLTALALVTRAHLHARQFAPALARAREWLSHARDEADAEHARARALVGLGRLVDARAAFDRACALRPSMVEAMLLRREVDRMMRQTAAQAGSEKPIAIEVPEHLAELRDALVTGSVDEAIAVLDQPAYAGDAIAKLVHAECLAFARRNAEAIEIYDLAATLGPEQRMKALLGKARALLALERASDAIAVLDMLGEPGVEALELRGLALTRLGLDGDADEAEDRVVAAAEHGSDLRLGR